MQRSLSFSFKYKPPVTEEEIKKCEDLDFLCRKLQILVQPAHESCRQNARLWGEKLLNVQQPANNFQEKANRYQQILNGLEQILLDKPLNQEQYNLIKNYEEYVAKTALITRCLFVRIIELYDKKYPKLVMNTVPDNPAKTENKL